MKNEILFLRLNWILRLVDKLDRPDKNWLISRLISDLNTPEKPVRGPSKWLGPKRPVGRPRKKSK